MELPIAQESYQTSTDALIRAVKKARAILAQTAGQPTSLEGATVFTDPDRPTLRSANWIGDINWPQGQKPGPWVDSLLA